ncbi:MAG: 1,4-alpha-glucan branching protein GlgB [Candidatus Cyclonatronum sp.]|uniref:1,4-alpha-glucan branching protein GlgB n=1 Tax=Cyclonatronum sp. TaxID=3024185 RepID=UPI0025BB95A2|nr:1,4-alpha-glucan branching protein GlgB [Cyclonatronum sp.]MCH8486513.1 1,4-alpha-glucan branching protein GlgB [Cyclonatronum sp.]
MESKFTNTDEANALIYGNHGNPFAFLGFQEAVQGKTKGLLVRVFKPGTESVVLIEREKNKRHEMEKIADEGLYELFFPRRKNQFAYKLELSRPGGTTEIVEDAYRFGSLISDFDLQLWGEGNHIRSYEVLGAHAKEVDGVRGVHFVVCAPSASRVSVVGPFNNWDGRLYPMRKLFDQGLWELFVPGMEPGEVYKYEIKAPNAPLPFLKADPYAFAAEKRPKTASIVADVSGFKWDDDEWISKRDQRFEKPMSIYELHLGSWKRHIADNSFYTYRELADTLIPYIKDLGYTHLELLPIAEHPYDPSWGYQVTGYYAPTSRFGSPEDFAYFVNECHKNDIGVILDWVPAHFTKDDHGLRQFDGTALYEHEDPRQGEHKDWGTKIFNFGRSEVKNFLISNAVFWIDKYHIDGLRVDAVASMLYLDYSREQGQWVPNKYGGRENLEAIDLLKRFNEVVHEEFPGVVTLAEESTSWPLVSRPTYVGGLGFDYKWNMGWMNDTLKYFQTDPIYRKYHHNQLTFSFIYAFTENFVLPFSHDEVVHMKRSMLDKMPGDVWQKFANLRALYSYMYGHPGKKLLFMGSEFGQWSEWNEAKELNWSLTGMDKHSGLLKMTADLNKLYQNERALHEVDFDWAGFEWIDFSDVDNSILAFTRYSKAKDEFVVCVYNFTPVFHRSYVFGVPGAGVYKTIFNSDSEYYGGSNKGLDTVQSVEGEWHGKPHHIQIEVPPLAGVMMKLVK